MKSTTGLGTARPIKMFERLSTLARPKKDTLRYRADITAGSLKVLESRALASVYLSHRQKSQVDDALIVANILKAKNPATAIRLGRLLKQRLGAFDEKLWKLISEGSHTEATQACLAAAIKQSPLLGDFFLYVVQEQYRIFSHKLTRASWEDYLEACRSREPEMPEWSSETRRRLKSSVFQVLAQAGYIDNTRSLKLQKVHLEKSVVNYLKEKSEQYVLRCMEVSP